ncbi:MAG: hypothetical protein ACKOEL_10590 [Planctomycetota bacterium]
MRSRTPCDEEADTSEKKDVNRAVSDAEGDLKDAEATARGLSPLPWTGAGASAMKTAIEAAKALDGLVDSAKTSVSAESLAKLARKAEEYAASLPPSIGGVKPTSLVPRTVVVPCINLTVTIPIKD